MSLQSSKRDVFSSVLRPFPNYILQGTGKNQGIQDTQFGAPVAKVIGNFAQ